MIVLFDGVCNLCNFTVNFIIDHDSQAKFKFAALQSEVGKSLLSQHQMPILELNSVIFIRDDKIFHKSTAVLEIAKQLDGFWSHLYILRWVPVSIRDWVYDQIAKNRYKLFGKKETCRIPTKELQQRFL
jgi:predicted DCC family thiol-disulfide oxidoreductase YuxK